MFETALQKGFRIGNKTIKSAVVPDRHEFIPDALDGVDITIANGFLHSAETGIGFQRLVPGSTDFL